MTKYSIVNYKIEKLKLYLELKLRLINGAPNKHETEIITKFHFLSKLILSMTRPSQTTTNGVNIMIADMQYCNVTTYSL